MSEIVLTRIDDRLIHGQVATQWGNKLGANVLLVANDAVAADAFKQELMNMIAPANTLTRYYAIDEINEKINELGDDKKVMILVETPADALRLVEAGVPIKEVNVGNIAMAEGKRAVSPAVAVDEADVEVFKNLQDKGIDLVIQRVPDTTITETEALFA